ncbi:endonuclease/exonuclease/phosphatase family protein [Sarocladium implicatum]|nr:endonuclease/exonuclease/phosphatase family protein [Sarocladium implicatum]
MKSFSSVGLAASALVGAALAATNGSISLLTINVAGLPEALQSNDVPGDKKTNARLIGSYLEEYNYDIIHVQEDFNYHAYIYEANGHPYRTATSGGVPFGSGLNTLANNWWFDFRRIKWNKCSNASGADCLTPKGFTFMRMHIDEGVSVDVYNLHADAGTESDDLEARASNIQQVADYISYWSDGNAVIVMGDTNTRYSRSDDNIRTLLTQNDLSDAWIVSERAGVVPTEESLCDNPSLVNDCEIVDKVFYRGNGIVSLDVTYFSYEGGKFLQPDGNILTDHNPIAVDLNWKLSATRRQSDFWGGPHGQWFNDLSSLGDNPKASVITFRGESRVDSVGLTLKSGTTFTHGGSGGAEVSLTLGDSEYWTSAKLCQAQRNGNTRIFYIEAVTSTGRTLSTGANTGECVTYSAPSGWQIVGYLGQSADEVDLLGFLYAPQ